MYSIKNRKCGNPNIRVRKVREVLTRFHPFLALNYSISSIIRSLRFAKISYILTDIYGIKPIGSLKFSF